MVLYKYVYYYYYKRLPLNAHSSHLQATLTNLASLPSARQKTVCI